MKRLTGIVQAKTNKALDRMEDPRETLDMAYEKRLEQLRQVRKSVADVATARKRVELQASQLQSTAAKLQEQARQALAQNREDLAREALSRRAGIAGQLEGLRGQHEQLASQEDGLVAMTQQLQAQLEAFRTQKETLKASYSAAQAQSRIGEMVAGISESAGDSGMAVQRAQDRIAQMQARAGAVDELLASGALNDLSGSVDPLQAELDRGTRQSQVDFELAQMKGQLATPVSPQTSLGSAGPAPLALGAAAAGTTVAPVGAPGAGASPGTGGGPATGFATAAPSAGPAASSGPSGVAGTVDPAGGGLPVGLPLAGSGGMTSGSLPGNDGIPGGAMPPGGDPSADDSVPVDGEIAPPAGSVQGLPGQSGAGDLFSLES
jgi:phage shock protein A